jgi:hypothetical protein
MGQHAMQNNSLFLGRMRAPVKTGMIVLCSITFALYLVLISQQMFAAEPYGMFEMIRPAGKPLVQVMLAFYPTRKARSKRSLKGSLTLCRWCWVALR